MRRDVEKIYTRSEFIAKLRRLADALEKHQRFVLQVAGKRVPIPRNAQISVEHEREGGEEEIEFQLKWSTVQGRSAAARHKKKAATRKAPIRKVKAKKAVAKKSATKKSPAKKARSLRRR